MARTNLIRALSLAFGIAVASTMPVSSMAASSITETTMHPLEDPKSWELHLDRQASASAAAATAAATSDGGWWDSATASLSGKKWEVISEGRKPPKKQKKHHPINDDDSVYEDEDEEWKRAFDIQHKKLKKNIPLPGGDTTHGILIDAGSKGTRLHIYEWEKRFLLDEADLVEQMAGLKLTYPTSNSRWTDKYKPGLSAFVEFEDQPDYLEKELSNYLGSLLDFAKMVLGDKKEEWHTYPIYLKATGGMRELPKKQRTMLIGMVRKLFHDKSYNPFEFQDERARVISGEEEAIYGWIGVNFAKDLLIDNSIGSGEGKHPKYTFGVIEMGGASTQIAFYENSEDIMANLFKLQLGGTRHWNVYVHSYLYFGVNGAWSRSNAHQYWKGRNIHPCLPTGSSLKHDSWMHLNENGQLLPRSDPISTPYSVTMVGNSTSFDYDHCTEHAYRILRKETNQEWCDFQWDGKCGFAGIYQPPIPKKRTKTNKFIATSTIADIYQFLRLPEKSYVGEIGQASENICSLDWKQLKEYNTQFIKPLVKTEEELAQMCFRSVFLYQLLTQGWGFEDDYKLIATDIINGHKTGWALGCMLYEINTLPWNFHPELLRQGPSKLLIAAFVLVGTLVGLAVGFILAMNCSKSFNEKMRKEFFASHPEFARNRVVRKSLALSVLSEDTNEGVTDETTKLVNKN